MHFDDVSYKQSQFTKKDYHTLYNMASIETGIKRRLQEAKFRDKRFQRTLITSLEQKVFQAPFNQLALYLNIEDNTTAKDILKWRLHINK